MSRNRRTTVELEELIYSVLPGLTRLPERVQRERVEELSEYCSEILQSHLPSSLPLSSNALPDIARRLLSTSDDALRFNSMWGVLERGRTLSNPQKALQFLVALSELDGKNESSVFPIGSSSTARPRSGLGPPAPPRAPSANLLGDTYSSTRGGHTRGPSVNLASPPPTPGGGGAKSKAALLKEWRTSRSRPPFPEELFIRDALYLLQGIDGRYVHFARKPAPELNPYLTEKGRAGEGAGFPLGAQGVTPPSEGEEEIVGIKIVADEAKVQCYSRVMLMGQDGVVSQPTQNLLVQLSEMGVLYRKITTFIDVHQEAGPSSKSGMVIQSLCHFLHHELSEYHRLLAVLESQMSLTASGSTAPSEGSGLTLLRLGLWTEDMKLKLRLMVTVVNDAKTAHGGALVSKIHSHTAHGDPFVRRFTDQILEEVSKPFFLTLQRWIFSGELHDPFNEFFVQLNSDVAKSDDPNAYAGDAGFEEGFDMGDGTSDSHHVWEKKYVFVKAMVPGFINEDFGKKIFSTGRSLNFIRYNCYDSEWISEQAGLANAGNALKYSDLTGLERSIDGAYSSASKRLLEIFFDKYKLLDHLRALKAYLMLGAGDFAELLMEALAPRLSKPAISLYRHHLTSDLESAIRGSNAQYDSPDVLRRLDARVLEYSHGELGWECFALEYKVEAPLNAILDASAMAAYDRLFHHLWYLKRVENALTQGWMRVTSASRAFESLPSLGNEWHHCRIVQAEMVHFLRQMQAFCQLEVIECSWKALLEYTDKRDGDLDGLITAHRTYLDRVVRKVLLLGSRHRDDSLFKLVQEALGNVLKFRDAAEDLYSWSLGEATRLDRLRDAERGLTVRKKATVDADQSDDDVDAAAEAEAADAAGKLDGVRERIRACSTGFQDAVMALCKEAGTHPDLDVRFLAIRIAFNGHYALKRSAKLRK